MTLKKITISITVLFTFVIFTEIAQAFNDEEKNEFRKGFIQGLTSSTAVEKKLYKNKSRKRKPIRLKAPSERKK